MVGEEFCDRLKCVHFGQFWILKFSVQPEEEDTAIDGEWLEKIWQSRARKRGMGRGKEGIILC